MSMMILVLSVLGCTQECDPGYGMVDGVCYELAKADGSGSDGTGTGDAGTGDDGTGGDGTGGAGSGDDGDGTGGDGTSGDGTGGDGTGGDGTSGDGSGGDGTGGDGTGGSGDDSSFVEVTGTLQVSGEPSASAICAISMWSASDVDPTTGLPDRSGGAAMDISNTQTPCPTDESPLVYSVNLAIPAADSVYLYASVDQDGDMLTPEDRAEEGSDANPLAAEPGGTLSDVAFTLTLP